MAEQQNHRDPKPSALFQPLKIGDITLENRILMAPMTRCRAGPDGIPVSMMADYYAQRAGAGLIVSEATHVAPEGNGFPRTPGIYSQSQVGGWAKITDAVHKKGGSIFLQLWHAGAKSHSSYHSQGQAPIAPSEFTMPGELYGPDATKLPFEPARSMTLSEIRAVIEQFAHSTYLADAAGFDGVEIHAGIGYLIEQFMRDGTNHRHDQYGGSIENRLRLPIEVVDAACAVIGPNRVGVRLSPFNWQAKGMMDSRPDLLFEAAARALDALDLAYLHIVEFAQGQQPISSDGFGPYLPMVRASFSGPIIVNGGYDAISGAASIATGAADAVAYGSLFLANPDLPDRFRFGAELNPPDISTFYSHGARGYTDYPFRSQRD